MTLPAGATSTTFAVPVLGDLVDEADETFSVTLSGPSGATINDGQAVVTIVDDDSAAIAAADVTVTETNAASNAVVTVTLSAPSASTVSVHYATVNGSAVAPADYVAQNGTLSFAPA